MAKKPDPAYWVYRRDDGYFYFNHIDGSRSTRFSFRSSAESGARTAADAAVREQKLSQDQADEYIQSYSSRTKTKFEYFFQNQAGKKEEYRGIVEHDTPSEAEEDVYKYREQKIDDWRKARHAAVKRGDEPSHFDFNPTHPVVEKASRENAAQQGDVADQNPDMYGKIRENIFSFDPSKATQPPTQPSSNQQSSQSSESSKTNQQSSSSSGQPKQSTHATANQGPQSNQSPSGQPKKQDWPSDNTFADFSQPNHDAESGSFADFSQPNHPSDHRHYAHDTESGSFADFSQPNHPSDHGVSSGVVPPGAEGGSRAVPSFQGGGKAPQIEQVQPPSQPRQPGTGIQLASNVNTNTSSIQPPGFSPPRGSTGSWNQPINANFRVVQSPSPGPTQQAANVPLQSSSSSGSGAQQPPNYPPRQPPSDDRDRDRDRRERRSYNRPFDLGSPTSHYGSPSHAISYGPLASVASTAIGAFTNPLKDVPVLGTIIKFGEGLAKAANAVATFADVVVGMNRKLAGFSGATAGAYAKLDVHDFMRTMSVAHGTADSSVKLVDAVDKMRDNFVKFDTSLINIQNKFATMAAGLAGKAGSGLGDFADKIDSALSAAPLAQLIAAMNALAAFDVEGAKEAMKKFAEELEKEGERKKALAEAAKMKLAPGDMFLNDMRMKVAPMMVKRPGNRR